MSITMIGAMLLAAEMGDPLTLSDAIEMLRKNAKATDGAASLAMRAMAEHFEVLHATYGLTCGSSE